MINRDVGESGFIVGEIRPHIHHEHTGFIVGTVDVGERPRLKVIGTIAAADLGHEVLMGGAMETDDRQGGAQFRIAGVVDTALTPEQLRAYLGSGLVRHVGAVTAALILETFGTETFRILTEEPDRLSEIRGLTPGVLPETKLSIATTMHLAGIVGLLAPFGVSLGIARQVTRRLGSEAATLIRANPWRLAMDFKGIAFPTADHIAMRLGHAPDAPERAEAALSYVVAIAARSGHTVVPRATALADAGKLVSRAGDHLSADLARLEARGALVSIVEPDGVSTPELAKAEARLALALAELLTGASDWQAGLDSATISELEAASGILFDDAQRDAVTGVLSRGVTVLTGGPGTGKTTIVRAVCDLAERHGLDVALMSFTGKAAKRLSEATGRPASTIHRYLRFTPGSGFKGPDNADDVVIVDEVSMLDVALADELTSWLSPRTRLVLVGDVDQLPSIGAGNVLGDLVTTGAIPVFRLGIIHRTDAASSIPVLARAINDGVEHPPYDGLTTRFIPRGDASGIADWVRSHFARYRDRVDEFQVLAPIKAGTAGVDNLNAIIANVLRGPASSHGRAIVRDAYDMCAGDRIIWTINDKDLGLFNGEIGALVAVRGNGSALVEFDGQTYNVPSEKVSANAFSLAYALTVHKAQGSEFKIVIVVMDGGHSMLQRRLLYTAVSRARDTVAVVGQAAAVAAAVRRHDTGHRQTALAPLLRVALKTPEAPSLPPGVDPDAPF